MKNLFIYTFAACAFGIGFVACDSTTSSRDLLSDTPAITDLSISPKTVQFTEAEDGFRDTTLSLTIQAETIHFDPSSTLEFTVTSKSSKEVLLEGILTEESSNSFTAQESMNVTTTTIEEYIVNVFVRSSTGNYAQASLKIRGFSNNPPEILETDGPDEITRPSSGEVPATFTSKVTDADGQETIDKVYIRVINQESGEVQGSPFEMFDDGSTYNDEVANDSTYTWSLPVTPTDNNPNRDFDIEFFAVDKGGLSSDTVRTTFSIRE